MNESRITEKFGRCLALVIGDFTGGAPEALAMTEMGARVRAAGLGTAAARKALAEAGVEAEVVRGRKKLLEASLERLPAADVVLFLAGHWGPEMAAVVDAERTEAAMDGRAPRPIVAQGDERLVFLRSPRQWAAFALALAAGARFEEARQFATRKKRGHEGQNTDAGTGGRSRAALPRRRNPR